MKYVLVGKLVNTHGLKGEVRILSDFKYKDRVFKKGMKIYLGKEKICEKIVSYRHHKIFEMIMMDGYSDISDVLKYKGEYVFINREDLVLNDGEYLDEEIVGLKVFVSDREIGVVKRIDKHGINEVLVVKGDKDYLIPYSFEIIIDVNLEKRMIKIKDIKGLVD